MSVLHIRLLIVSFLLCVSSLKAQETLPIYTDYLSDNVFLVHPSAAGIGNSSKLRLTARQQWFDVPNAPSLQTLSFHTKFGEVSNAGYGLVLFNDKNGFHSQQGLQGTYAYHLPMSKGKLFEQLSFGLAFTFVQNQADQRTFLGDPAVAAIVQSTSYYNADFSMAYHRGGFFSYFTLRNLFLTATNNVNISEPVDLKNFVFSSGYYFGKDAFVQLEPSVMVQYKQGLGETIADFNLKIYKNLSKAQLWAALSYRQNFDNNSVDNASYLSPVLGVNYKNWMFSYVYTRQLNDVLFAESGFHQISLGINLWTREQRAAACPNINASYGSF